MSAGIQKLQTELTVGFVRELCGGAMRRLQIHNVVHCSSEAAISSGKTDLPTHSSRKKSTEIALLKKTCSHGRNIIAGQVVAVPIAPHALQETTAAVHRVHSNMDTVARAPQSIQCQIQERHWAQTPEEKGAE